MNAEQKIEDQVPFLIQKADRVSVSADEAPAQDESVINPEWFHTRCGHPRHRDD